ncbi:MAG: TerC family protein [Pirellulales bacterium]
MLDVTSLTFWVLFHVLVAIAIYVDLFVLNRENTNNNMKLNLVTVAMWMAAGLGFGFFVWQYKGSESAMNYWTGYLLEQSLSVDNLFVFLVIFQYFAVEGRNQRRALVWGILAAIVLRGIFIFAGVALVSRFNWLMYPLGAFLVYTGAKLLTAGSDESVDPEKNPALRFCRKFLPLTEDYVDDRFTVRRDGKLLFTPLFVVLVVINVTDVMFATDSIPAIIGVTRDPFVVYTSNIFAVCGLRALYFALAGMFDRFHMLQYGLAIVLVFIGAKMLIEYPIEHYLGLENSTVTVASLGVVGSTLVGSVILSLLIPLRKAGLLGEEEASSNA